MNPITGMLEQAVEAYAIGDFARAVKICDDVLKRDPSNSRALAYRALANFERVLRGLGEHFTALTVISVALQRDISDAERRQHIKTTKAIWATIVSGTDAFVASLTRGLGLDPALHHEFPPSTGKQYAHHWHEGIGKCLTAVIAQVDKLDAAEGEALRERLSQIEAKYFSLVRKIESPPDNLPDAVTDYSGSDGARDDDFPAFDLADAGPAKLGDESHADLVSVQDLTDDGMMLTGSEVQFVRFSGEAGPLTRLDIPSDSIASNETLDVEFTQAPKGKPKAPPGPTAEELAEQAAQRAAEKMREALDAERAKFDAERQRQQAEMAQIRKQLAESEARARKEAEAADAARRDAEARAQREAERARAAQIEAEHRAQLEIERARAEQLRKDLARLEAEKQADRERMERIERAQQDRQTTRRHAEPQPAAAPVQESFFTPPEYATQAPHMATKAPGTASFSPEQMAADVAERVSKQIIQELAIQQKSAKKPDVAKTLHPDELAQRVAAVLAAQMRTKPEIAEQPKHLTKIAAAAAEAVPAKVADKMASDPNLRRILDESADPRLRQYGAPPPAAKSPSKSVIGTAPDLASLADTSAGVGGDSAAFFEPPRAATTARTAPDFDKRASTVPPMSPPTSAPSRMVHPTPPGGAGAVSSKPTAVAITPPSPTPVPSGPLAPVQQSVGEPADMRSPEVPIKPADGRIRFLAHEQDVPLESPEGQTLLAQVRHAYGEWVRERPGHPWPQAAEKLQPVAIRRGRLYGFQLAILFENRQLRTGEGAYRDEPLPSVPITPETANPWTYSADVPVDFRARHAVFRLPDSFRLIDEDPTTGGRRLQFVELHLTRRPHVEMLVYPGELLPKKLDVEKLFGAAKIVTRETFEPFLRGPDVDRLFPEALRPAILEMARQLRASETDESKIRGLSIAISEAPLIRLAYRLPGAPSFRPQFAGEKSNGVAAESSSSASAGMTMTEADGDANADTSRIFSCSFMQLEPGADPTAIAAATGAAWHVIPDGDIAAEYEEFLRIEAEWSAAHGRANRTQMLTRRLLTLDPGNEDARHLRQKIRQRARWDYVAGFVVGTPLAYGLVSAVWHMAPPLAFAFLPFLLVICGIVTGLLWRLVGVRIGSRPGRLILTALVVGGIGVLSPWMLREVAKTQHWSEPNFFQIFTTPKDAAKMANDGPAT